MGRKQKETTLSERQIILKLYCKGKTMREVGELVGRSHTTVQSVINKFKNEGTLLNKTRCGRKKILTRQNENFIVRKIKQNPHENVPKLAVEVANIIGKPISTETVRRVLRRSGYHARVPRQKPYISEQNRKKRLEFANSYKNHNLDFWKSVLFTDESKFMLWGSDKHQMVWRKPNTQLKKENLQLTIKHGGGSVMVWGSVAASGVGNLEFVETNMDRFKYLDILKRNLRPTVEKLGLQDRYYFLQDNDPKHTAGNINVSSRVFISISTIFLGIVKEWLLYNVQHQLHTPPQSPDINIIENVWAELEKRIRQHKITNKQMLKQKLLEEWQKIDINYLNNLAESMPRRLKAIIKAKGYQTKY